MAESYDRAYRMLFSFPRMVEDLVRLFVGGDWVERLDFSTLEKLSEQDVSSRLVRREKDLLWRLKFRPEAAGKNEAPWCYIYLQLEFQSRSYRFMPLRTVTYTALLYEDLVRRKHLTASGKLPPVLSIVLYNGEAPWNGPTSLEDLIEKITDPPQGMNLLDFRLVEARSLPLEALQATSSPVAELFRLEQAEQPPEIGRATLNLHQQLQDPASQELRQAFETFLEEVILEKIPRLAEEKRPINSLEEAATMIAQKIERWAQEAWQRGVAEGEARGRAEGKAEGEARGRAEGKAEGFRLGEARALLRLLEKRFGEVPDPFQEQVQRADVDSLQRWLDRTLTAESLEQVFSV